MKITIREGKLFIDDVEKETKDLTTEFLEGLLEAAINQNVDFNLEDDTHPLYDFFINLEKDTLPESDFMKEIKEIEEEVKSKDEKLKGFDTKNDEDEEDNEQEDEESSDTLNNIVDDMPF